MNRFNIYTGLLKAYVGDDGKKHLQTTASSSIADLAGDEIMPPAIEQMALKAKDNLTIFLNHEYRVPEDVLGSVTDTRMATRGVDGDGNPIVDLDFDIRVNEENPRALQTYAAIDAGTKLGTSIGAIVRHATKKKGGGLKIDDIELLEASIVGIPANPRSWVHYAAKSLTKAEDAPIDDEPVIEDDLDPTLKETHPLDEPEIKLDSAEPDKTAAVCPECNKSSDTCDCESCSCKKDAVPTVDESDPDKVAARTRVTVTVDSDAQGAPASTPETALMDEDHADTTSDPATAELSDAVTRSADSMEIEKADLTVLVKRVSALIEENASLRKQYDELKTKSDEDSENLVVARQIIDRIADLPVGRKTHFAGAVEDYRARFPQYDNEFIKMLEK